jgi:hypothetical protein
MESFMQMSETQGRVFFAFLFLLLLLVVTVVGLAVRGLLNLLDHPVPDPTPHGEDSTPAGKWVLVGLLLIMLAGLAW